MLVKSRFSIKSMLIVTLNTFRGMQGSISYVYPKLGCLTFRFCELRQLLCALKQKELAANWMLWQNENEENCVKRKVSCDL